MSFWGIWFASGASQAPLILFCISVRSVAIAHLPFTWRLPYTHAFSWVRPIFVSAPCLQQNFPTDTPGNTDPSIHTTQTDNYNKTRCFPHETDKTFPPTRTRWVTDESLFALDGSHLTSSTSQIRIPQKRTDSLEGPACIIGRREDNGIFWCDVSEGCWSSSWLLQSQSRAAVATHQLLHQAQGFPSRLPTKPQAWLWALRSASATDHPLHTKPHAPKGPPFPKWPLQEQCKATQLRGLVCPFCLPKSAHTDWRLVQIQDKTQPNDNRKHGDNVNNWSHSERSDLEKFF